MTVAICPYGGNVPKGPYVVPFLGLLWFVGKGKNLPPKKEHIGGSR